jgi:hypothetical protein
MYLYQAESMENVVPGVLQRLRAADILRMAGLNAAALGQEYCRVGFVQEPRRQGAKLFGVVNNAHADSALTLSNDNDDSKTGPKTYSCEVEVKGPASWVSKCTCNAETSLLCPHAAALLYLWLSHPSAFVTVVPPVVSQQPEEPPEQGPVVAQKEAPLEVSTSARSLPPRPATILPGQTPSGNIMEILAQSGLSELRSIAREYEIVSNGLNKQQLVEVLVGALRQPEVVRRVATTLQKSQRQLLAAITLAGGFVNDDDLRGLFERFSLGGPDQLQQVLLVLQSKAFLLRTSLHSANSPKIGLSDSLLDSGWYVPLEVRSALRVTVPTTVFKLESGDDAQESQPLVQQSAPYDLLANLLLVARALDGYYLEPEEDWQERPNHGRSYEAPSFARAPGASSNDGSIPIPPPVDLPPSTLIDRLLPCVPLPPDLLHFAVRLLRQADILYRDDESTPYLRSLANAAQLFLGTNRAEVSRDLFELWLTQSSYAELFGLQKDNLRLRCRATALNLPVLRPGELDAENKDARQTLLALLAQVPLHQWVNFSAFARFVYRLNPLFLQRKQRLYSTPHWWLELEPGRPLRPLHLQDWLRAEAHYLARLISGPLFWWGACDIATDKHGQLLAFRLTPVAAWLFAGSRLADEDLVAKDYSILTRSLEIVDIEEILVACNVQNWPVIEVLETFAQPAGVRNGRLCYRLTPGALAGALGHGHNPATLLQLLRSAVPQAVSPEGPLLRMLERLERWINGYGRMRIYTGVTLLESIDTVVMRELSATTALDEQVVQAVNPTLLVLKKSGMEQIIDELKRRGQSPLLHDDFSIPNTFNISNVNQESPYDRPAPDILHEQHTPENHQRSVE